MSKKIFVAGHNGLVGSALVRALESSAKTEEAEVFTISRKELDLLNQTETFEYLSDHKFDQIYLAAAKVGGIRANSIYAADFIYENLLVQNNVIYGAWKAGTGRLLFLGSSCIYPKFAKQPIEEAELLNGSLEPTNSAYAVAKIAGLQMCKNFNQQYGADFRAVMPTNLYGVNDNFHLENAHVLPALIRRIHDAKVNGLPKVVIWGSGKPRREFMNVEDMASGCIHVMELTKEKYFENVQPEFQYFNIGTGDDVSIRDLALIITKVVGYEGELTFDTSKPDGTPRKLLNVDRINKTGWKAKIELEQGIAETYDWFKKNIDSLRA